MSQSDLVAYAAPARPVAEPPKPALAARHPATTPGPVLDAPTLTPDVLSAWSMPRLWTW